MPVTDILTDILRRTNIVSLATKLGITVGRREANHNLAICPFHDDKTASLALYPDPGNPHYHCFACGAHGGALQLIEHQLHQSRADALRWLARETGVPLSENATDGRGDLVAMGRIAFEAWAKRHNRPELLRKFAQQREIDLSALTTVGARAVDMDKLKPGELSLGDCEAMETAGVIARRRGVLVPIARGSQVIFPLGSGSGYIFRAIGDVAHQYKSGRYRFSKNLRKSNLLFGAERAHTLLQSGNAPDGLFVVEGITDALRLHSLGLAAVAILGTSLSRLQVQQIHALTSDNNDLVLPVHLFLDGDNAGRRAVPGCLRMLFSNENPTPVDVIWPDIDGDPDELLKQVNPTEARTQLASWTHSAIAAFVHSYTCLPIAEGIASLPTARPLLRVEMLRYLVSQLGGNWAKIRDLADPTAVFLNGARQTDATWLRDAIDRIVGLRPSDESRVPQEYSPSAIVSHESDTQLRRALRIAQSSNFRREYPFDWGGMTRLALAANVSIFIGRALLNQRGRKPIPYAARTVPKDDGRVRLKAGPWPEDALL
jgi:DNA primase catalytic core